MGKAQFEDSQSMVFELDALLLQHNFSRSTQQSLEYLTLV